MLRHPALGAREVSGLPRGPVRDHPVDADLPRCAASTTYSAKAVAAAGSSMALPGTSAEGHNCSNDVGSVGEHSVLQDNKNEDASKANKDALPRSKPAAYYRYSVTILIGVLLV